MTKKITVFFLLLFAAIALYGCASGELPTPKPGEFYEISVDKAQELIEKEPKPLVLDVRTPEEFQGGHIPGAQLLPLDNLEAEMGNLDKNQTIIVVCLSGERSKFASRILAQNGFTRVYNMAGGMSQWKGSVE